MFQDPYRAYCATRPARSMLKGLPRDVSQITSWFSIRLRDRPEPVCWPEPVIAVSGPLGYTPKRSRDGGNQGSFAGDNPVTNLLTRCFACRTPRPCAAKRLWVP